MKKNIFITGVSSELLQFLISFIDLKEYNIIGLSRKLKSFPNLKIINCNINQICNYKNDLIKSDIIIHGAGLTHSYNTKDYLKINFLGTKILVDSIKKYNKKFIFISSY